MAQKRHFQMAGRTQDHAFVVTKYGHTEGYRKVTNVLIGCVGLL
jgi:hypothetical protein